MLYGTKRMKQERVKAQERLLKYITTSEFLVGSKKAKAYWGTPVHMLSGTSLRTERTTVRCWLQLWVHRRGKGREKGEMALSYHSGCSFPQGEPPSSPPNTVLHWLSLLVLAYSQ